MVKIFLFALIGTFPLISCKFGNDKPNVDVEKEVVAKPIPPKSEGSIRVLFVGNSHTDNSHHLLNDAGFLNTIVLYQTLFNETPKIPQKLPLSTGTGDNDDITLQEVTQAVSNPEALKKIAATYK